MSESDYRMTLQLLADNSNALRDEIKDSANETRQELKELKEVAHTILSKVTQHTYQITVLEAKVAGLLAKAEVLDQRVTTFENLITTVKYLRAVLWVALPALLTIIFGKDTLQKFLPFL
jgi:chromosome segregation ATPase